jgi:ABC-2 type transport system ATP-binding protein
VHTLYAEDQGATVRRPAIETVGLEKSYGTLRVLSGVDLRVAPGSVFALLGPNGAGKTTMVRLLSTLSRPDAGSARVDGLDVVADVHAVRRRISLTGQYAALDELQTGEENLRMLGRLARLSRPRSRARARELLDRFELTDAGGRRVATYSGGMRRRLDLAASLVGEPSIIFLDEPTTGLDPRSRQTMWNVVTGLADSGVTVFLTTQYLEEADRLADRIAVLHRGRVVARGTPDELKRRFADQRLELVFPDATTFGEAARLLDGRALVRDPGRLLIGVATDGSAAQVRGLLDEIDPGGRAIESFSLHRATLDDVFMSLTGEEAADD